MNICNLYAEQYRYVQPNLAGGNKTSLLLVAPARGYYRVLYVKNSWWYGGRIRLTPYGWLYNVAGRDAVEGLLKNGKKIRIGINEPDQQSVAIDRAIR